jgi:hypothetical protein
VLKAGNRCPMYELWSIGTFPSPWKHGDVLWTINKTSHRNLPVDWRYTHSKLRQLVFIPCLTETGRIRIYSGYWNAAFNKIFIYIYIYIYSLVL